MNIEQIESAKVIRDMMAIMSNAGNGLVIAMQTTDRAIQTKQIHDAASNLTAVGARLAALALELSSK